MGRVYDTVSGSQGPIYEADILHCSASRKKRHTTCGSAHVMAWFCKSIYMGDDRFIFHFGCLIGLCPLLGKHRPKVIRVNVGLSALNRRSEVE